ncbi:MAG: MBL fold metallo-hydrolase [Anaerolineae bacterium]|nr:MAG: MBL fold metallo-hydrolase [Anaerolineae bacterium]
MKIHFWGAAQTVTGSAHYLEVNGKILLLDCGLFQGRRADTYRINSEFRFNPAKVDGVVLSHAHIDHIGNLPNFIKQGYRGRVHTHAATAHLAEVMLADSGRIQEYDAQFVNKRRARRGEPPVEPLYTEEDAVATVPFFEHQALNKPFSPIPGVQVTLVEAGHILGSTALKIEIEEKRKTHTLWFSGDIGRVNLPLIHDPVLPSGDVDTMLMECTYGDRSHESPDVARAELARLLRRTLERDGKVLIPAFAVGRTQELVYAIHRLMDSSDLPNVPVFVDSPLAVSVTDIFKKHPDCFDEEARAMMSDDQHRSALGFDSLTYIRSVEESKALNERTDPMIIIAASGMMENGRILHHLRNNIHDANSTVLIVSWMAPHTLGRRLTDGDPKVNIFGEEFDVAIDVQRVRGYSAHGDREALRDYALAVRSTLQNVYLVHGEQEGADGLTEALTNWGMDAARIHYPARGDTIEL